MHRRATIPASPVTALDGGCRVIVVVLPHMHLLDLAGPVQVFSEANEFGARYHLLHCALTPTLRTAQGLLLADLAPLPEPSATDLVVIPGMESTTLHELRPHVPTAWLRRAAAAGARVASICSGAFALGYAGLLDGRDCTTHWKVVDRLQQAFPRARVLGNRLYVRGGRIITSAGVASGIDLALALVEEDHGPLMVGKVAREMVIYLRRDGDHEQTSIYLDHRTHLHPGVHRVQDWLVAHPDEKPALAGLARMAGMSVRNLTRVFRQATGVSPRAYANRVKVQVAQDLLRSPDLTVEAIAASCGFDDARQLRRLWKQSHGVALSTWRRESGAAMGGS